MLRNSNKESIKEYTGESGTLLYPSQDNFKDGSPYRNTNNWSSIGALGDFDSGIDEVRELCRMIGKTAHAKIAYARGKSNGCIYSVKMD